MINSNEQSNGTWSWTYTTILGDSLSKAEQQFGIRDLNYTILGIEYVNTPVPYVWYPGNKKHIVIRLTPICQNNFNQGVFQLTHEVIHCLSPVYGGQATVLEEGLATAFSTEYSKNWGGLFATDSKYLNAKNLVDKLLHIDRDIVKKVRQVQPEISKMTSLDLRSINPNIPITLADDLTVLF